MSSPNHVLYTHPTLIRQAESMYRLSCHCGWDTVIDGHDNAWEEADSHVELSFDPDTHVVDVDQVVPGQRKRVGRVEYPVLTVNDLRKEYHGRRNNSER